MSLVHPRNSDYLSQGFSLKKDARLRVYAIGERDNSRRSMADYGTIMDASTREKVWTMDVDRTSHAGGASKNQYIDEIITLPRGNYVVTYTTDDSHTYDDWNSDPPYDKEHYGITVMGVGEKWDPSIVSKYTEERDKNLIAQIIRPGDNVDASRPFTLDKATRLRVYAIGEGMGREMDDYGWIEDARTGTVVWEMTYRMTFHAGGDRKNRMVNTTILLDRGDYRLRYKSDDSHSFGDWNADPPDDQQYWGITLYRDSGLPRPAPATPRCRRRRRSPRTNPRTDTNKGPLKSGALSLSSRGARAHLFAPRTHGSGKRHELILPECSPCSRGRVPQATGSRSSSVSASASDAPRPRSSFSPACFSPRSALSRSMRSGRSS